MFFGGILGVPDIILYEIAVENGNKFEFAFHFRNTIKAQESIKERTQSELLKQISNSSKDNVNCTNNNRSTVNEGRIEIKTEPIDETDFPLITPVNPPK